MFLLSSHTVRMFLREYGASEIRKALEVYKRTKSFRKSQQFTGIGKSTIQRWWVSFHTLFIRHPRQKRKTKRHRSSKFQNLDKSIHQLFQSSTLEFLSLRQIQGKLQALHPSLPTPCLSWLSKALRTGRRRRQPLKPRT